MRHLYVLFVAFASFQACKTGGTAQCSTNDGCGSGEVCQEGVCLHLCNGDSDCATNERCATGTCVVGARIPPVIDSVDASLDPMLTITGQNLGDSTVTLDVVGGAHWDLVVCSNTSTELVVELPSNLTVNAATATSYVLAVANQSGACNATLPVLRGAQGLQGLQGDQGVQGVAGPAGVPCSNGCVDTASLGDLQVTDAKIDSVTTRSKLPSELAYTDTANAFTMSQSVGGDLTVSGDISAANLTATGLTVNGIGTINGPLTASSITAAGIWTRIYENTVLAASQVTVSGLDGDRDKAYRIVFYGNLFAAGGDHHVLIRVNGLSSGYNSYAAFEGTAGAGKDTDSTGFYVGRNAFSLDAGLGFDYAIFTQIGVRRMGFGQATFAHSDNTILGYGQASGLWINTTTNVNSLTITTVRNSVGTAATFSARIVVLALR